MISIRPNPKTVEPQRCEEEDHHTRQSLKKYQLKIIFVLSELLYTFKDKTDHLFK
jgi:hypothetical protein